MAGFSWEDAVLIKYGDGKAVTLPVQKIGDHTFFHLRKKCTSMKHLLQSKCGDATGERLDVLAKTDIIEKIKVLKDDYFRQGACSKEMPASLSQRYTHKRNRASVLLMPELCTITAPGFDGIAETPMVVVCSKPTSKFMVELTTDNFEYLASVIAMQSAAGNLHRKHARDNTAEPEDILEPGISCAYGRQAYRCTLKDFEGKVLTSFVPWSTHGRADAMRRACLWMRMHKLPCSDTVMHAGESDNIMQSEASDVEGECA